MKVTREAAIELVGLDVVTKAESGGNADYTGRITEQTDPGKIEFSDSAAAPAESEYERLTVYWLFDAGDMPEDGDLGSLDWTSPDAYVLT